MHRFAILILLLASPIAAAGNVPPSTADCSRLAPRAAELAENRRALERLAADEAARPGSVDVAAVERLVDTQVALLGELASLESACGPLATEPVDAGGHGGSRAVPDAVARCDAAAEGARQPLLGFEARFAARVRDHAAEPSPAKAEAVLDELERHVDQRLAWQAAQAACYALRARAGVEMPPESMREPRPPMTPQRCAAMLPVLRELEAWWTRMLERAESGPRAQDLRWREELSSVHGFATVDLRIAQADCAAPVP